MRNLHQRKSSWLNLTPACTTGYTYQAFSFPAIEFTRRYQPKTTRALSQSHPSFKNMTNKYMKYNYTNPAHPHAHLFHFQINTQFQTNILLLLDSQYPPVFVNSYSIYHSS